MIDKNDILFDDKGDLVLALFDTEAIQLLEDIHSFLKEVGRNIFLPIDVLTVLLEKDCELGELIATNCALDAKDLPKRLKALATEIEEDESPQQDLAQYNCAIFSKGFTRILYEALSVALNAKVKTGHIRAVIRWKIESTESASIRWALRRLQEGPGNPVFDPKGRLNEELCEASILKLFALSVKIAASQGTPFLGTPHLIAACCVVPQSLIWNAAKFRGLMPDRLKGEMLRLLGTSTAPVPEFKINRKTLTPRLVRIFSQAFELAEGPFGEAHLIEAFLMDGGSSLDLIQALGLEPEIRRLLGDPKILEISAPLDRAIQFGKAESTPTLDLLGRDLTADALSGKLPEIVGRDRELQRMINVLLRKEQRNPLLTGEAGVGKTALAVALAQRIAKGNIPTALKGYRVIEINGASLMSGTNYRGDLEARIKGLLKEASEKVILFIDEAHSVFSPRSGSHAPAEIPNYFKSALASGEIAVIGATTESEYRRWIEQDPALKRRFERIDVAEPSLELVRHILDHLVETLEEDYKVSILPESVEAAISFSIRFLPEQRLPDKAKKLLMDACIASANNLTEVEANDESNEFAKVSDESNEVKSVVKVLHVAEQIVYKTGIPLERVIKGQLDWWMGLEEHLNDAVIGQTKAIHEIAKALIRTGLRRSDPTKPIATFLFLGPSDVGKKPIAKLLADIVFGDVRAFVNIELADFNGVHSMSRLIGAPPGYVGYEDEDILVTPLRRRPASVVFLQDFDSAHPNIQQQLLRMIEDGQISDTRGYVADLRNAIFIFSVESQSDNSKIGFANKARTPVHTSKPGLDRVTKFSDAVIYFDGLVSEDVNLSLLRRYVDRVVNAMASEYKISLVIDKEVHSQLEESAKEMVGPKAIEKLVDQMLLDPTTEVLLGAEDVRSIVLTWNENMVIAKTK